MLDPVTNESGYAKAYQHGRNARIDRLHPKMSSISKAMMFASDISTDLDSGRRPELKSVEISDANIIVFEI